MNWWEQDPVVSAGPMDVAKSTADWWQNDPVIEEGPVLSETDKRMDARVAKEAGAGLAPRPSPAQYLPFGSWLDEAAAGLDAGLGAVTGGRFGSPSYEEAKAYQNARQRYIDANASGLEKGAAMAGGIVASGPLPAVNFFKGATLLPAIGNASLTGAAYGGVYGSGEGEGWDRAGNAAMGTAVGGATGAVLAPVARGVGNAISYVKDRMRSAPGVLANYDRNAVNALHRDFTSDGMTPRSYASRADMVGEDGMLADIGEDMLLTTNALGNTPGRQMNIVRGALGERQDLAQSRIKDTLDNEMGVPKDIPKYMREQKARYSKLAAPYYAKFEKEKIPMSPRLESILKRVDASGVVDEAERLAKIEGKTLGRVRNAPAPVLGDDFSPKERVELTQLKETLAGTGPDDAKTIWDMFQYAKAAKVDKSQSLASWLVSKGGVKNQGDEVRYILGRVKDRPGLVNQNGMDIDDAALAAWQAGFFKSERPTVAEFLNALDDDLSGISKVARGADAKLEEIDRRVASDMESELYNLGIGMNTPDRVLRKALGMAPPKQEAPTSNITPMEWDYYKRGIQALIDRKYPADTEMGRALTQLDNDLRSAIDETINPAAPQSGSWAMARRLYGEGAQGRAGVETGRKVFRGEGARPYDLNEEMRLASEYKKAGIKIGARDELNSKMGRAATNFGRNGDAKARRALNSDFSRENLETIIGPIRAERVSRKIYAENTMADTFNEVMANSATAKRQAAQRRLPFTSEKPLSDAAPSTLGAMAATGAKKILNVITSGTLNERAERIMADQARMLTARGIKRDEIAQNLLQLANQRNLTAAQRDNVAKVLNTLLRGAPSGAAEYASPSSSGQRANP